MTNRNDFLNRLSTEQLEDLKHNVWSQLENVRAQEAERKRHEEYRQRLIKEIEDLEHLLANATAREVFAAPEVTE